MKKAKKIMAVLIILTLVLGLAACSKTVEKVSAQEAPAPIKNNSVEAFGVVKAVDISNVNIGFNASVLDVAVREGQKVQKGDVMMTLDLKDYLTQINAKQHELNVLRLEIRKLQSKMIESDPAKSKDPDVKKLVNDLKYTEQVYQSALKEQLDKEELYHSGVLTKYELDEFVKSVEGKKKAVDDLSYSLDIAIHNKQIGNKELTDNIDIQKERANALEKEIVAMKDKLNQSYMKGQDIVAHVENGVVYDIGYSNGDIASPAKKALSIMNLDGMIIKANVSEEFIKDIKPGLKVEITPIADKTKKYTGVVALIASKAEMHNGETVIPVEITIENNDGFLLPEYNVDVEIFH